MTNTFTNKLFSEKTFKNVTSLASIRYTYSVMYGRLLARNSGATDYSRLIAEPVTVHVSEFSSIHLYTGGISVKIIYPLKIPLIIVVHNTFGYYVCL